MAKRYALSQLDLNITPKRTATGKPRKPRTNALQAWRERDFEGPHEYIYVNEAGTEVHAKDTPGNGSADKTLMMREARDVMDLHRRLASYCDPDNFDMYITNDHFGEC
jgi:hypothetical protein